MDRTERVARISSKMSHPSMNVKHMFHLLTDKVVDVEKKCQPHEKFAVSVSPQQTPSQRAESEWFTSLRAQYAAGLLN
jgi:hypothetical protein